MAKAKHRGTPAPINWRAELITLRNWWRYFSPARRKFTQIINTLKGGNR
jgi:hypothetical protein